MSFKRCAAFQIFQGKRFQGKSADKKKAQGSFPAQREYKRKERSRKSALLLRSVEFERISEIDKSTSDDQQYYYCEQISDLMHRLSFQEERKRVLQYSLPELSLFLSLNVFRFPVFIDGKTRSVFQNTLIVFQAIDDASHNRFLLLISLSRIVCVESTERSRLIFPEVTYSLDLLDAASVRFQRCKKELILQFDRFFSLRRESAFPYIVRKLFLLRLLKEVFRAHILERFRFLFLFRDLSFHSCKLFLLLNSFRCFLLLLKKLFLLNSKLLPLSVKLSKLSFQFLFRQLFRSFDDLGSRAFQLLSFLLYFHCFLFDFRDFQSIGSLLNFLFLNFRCFRFHSLSFCFHFRCFRLDVASNVICRALAHSSNSPDLIVKDTALEIPTKGKTASISYLLTGISKTYYFPEITVGFDVFLSRKQYFAVGLWLHLRYFQRCAAEQGSARLRFPIALPARSRAAPQQAELISAARVCGFPLLVTDGFGAGSGYVVFRVAERSARDRSGYPLFPVTRFPVTRNTGIPNLRRGSGRITAKWGYPRVRRGIGRVTGKTGYRRDRRGMDRISQRDRITERSGRDGSPNTNPRDTRLRERDRSNTPILRSGMVRSGMERLNQRDRITRLWGPERSAYPLFRSGMDRVSGTFGAGSNGDGMDRDHPVPPTMPTAAAPKTATGTTFENFFLEKEKFSLIPVVNQKTTGAVEFFEKEAA